MKNSYIVQLVALSFIGLMTLARSQKATYMGAAIRTNGVWRMVVQLPDRGFRA